MNLLLRLSNTYCRHLNRKVERIMRALYPDDDDRASAYACMAAEAVETAMFGDGDTLGALTVVPMEDGGYYVSASNSDEVESDV